MYYDGSMGHTHQEDIVELSWKNEGNDETLDIKLDVTGYESSNYAYSENEEYDADLTVLQLAKIVAEKGFPESIFYSHTDVNDTPGQMYVNEEFGGNIKFSEVHEDILNAARTLLSLEDIGKVLNDKSKES